MLCSVENCNTKVYCSGLCSTHYNRKRTTGTTDPGPKARLSLEERFWRNVEIKDKEECWEWQAKSKVKGYGVISTGGRRGKKVLTHRLSWELHNGPIPENKECHHGNVIMHKCDNRLCVNPNHLILGTQGDNVADMDQKKRRVNSPRLGSSHHATTISEAQAAEVYTMSGKYRDIAEKIGCTVAVVKAIKCQVTWSHVTKDLIRG